MEPNERTGQDTAVGDHAGGGAYRELVVVGASAGGVEPLRALVAGLPGGLPAAVLVVLHTAPTTRSRLAKILQGVAALAVTEAEDMAPVRPGQVYVARPDCHLVLRDGAVRLGRGPKENGHRPAVDPLFRSAARWYSSRAVAVVLSGVLDDGAAGAVTVARRGGAVAVQDPQDAMFDGMPSAVLRAVRSAVAAPAGQLAEIVTRLLRSPAARAPAPADADLETETDLAELAGDSLDRAARLGVPSGVDCPDCQGVLHRVGEGESFRRYRCRVGHAWSPQSLQEAKHEGAEEALWIALRHLEERGALLDDLADDASRAGRRRSTDFYSQRSEETRRAAEVIRRMLAGYAHGPAPDDATADI